MTKFLLAFVATAFVPWLASAQTMANVRIRADDGKIWSSKSEAQSTPIGSLWKLFVYAYQVENGRYESPYVCRGGDPEEVFCCKQGETIDREEAIAKSCGPYFQPKRLSIEAADWKKFWDLKISNTPSWLSNLADLTPERRIDVDELLRTLNEMRTNLSRFDAVEAGVLGTLLYGTGQYALKTWGSRLRVKTFTWRDELTKSTYEADKLGFVGGFAGWLADGRSVWVAHAGHGRDALGFEQRRQIELLLRDSHTENFAGVDRQCVEVEFFDRYPIATVTPASEKPKGPVTVVFKNGNRLQFQGDGLLTVDRRAGRIRISGKMGVDEYVARVINREVKTEPIEAARAFSIAIRTFLHQNSKAVDGCRKIADSSHLQRVNPSPPSPEARAIAAWSSGLVLDRVENLRYHTTKSSTNRMSWTDAVRLAEDGVNSVEILKTYYPTGRMMSGNIQGFKCLPNGGAEKWITTQSKIWYRRLVEEPGFEQPENLKVCMSQSPGAGRMARVFAHTAAQEVFVPQVRTREDEISVLHEYLHIGFRSHPRGRDERFIENLARTILEEL